MCSSDLADCTGALTPAARRGDRPLAADARVEAEGTLPDGVELVIGGARSTLRLAPAAGTGVVTWRVQLVLTTGAGESRAELVWCVVEVVVVLANRPAQVPPEPATTTTTTEPSPTTGFFGVLNGLGKP